MSRKPRILILIDWYLPGYRAGGPTRSCANLIEHLKDDFDFSVITRNTDYMSDVPYSEIKSNEWNVLPDGTRVYYFSSDRLTKNEIHHLLDTEEYDRIYLNGIFSKYFTLVPLRHRRGQRRSNIIVASRGMLAESALAIKKWKKKMFLLFARQFGLFAGVVFHATNNEEAASIRKVFGKKALIQVAPNLPERTASLEWKQKVKLGALRLVSVARIAPEKNIKFALEVLKEVKADVCYDLYGPVYDKEYWDVCKEIIRQLPSNIKVNFLDSIESARVSEILSGYHLLFLPTRGENFGHVILQSMILGVPVIISDKTMWQRLESKNAGWDIPLSEKSRFVSVIENCAKMSQAEYDLFSKGAFHFALSYVNNKESLQQNRELFLK